MDVCDIVKKYLIENGYDGLYTDGCGCLVDDLMPCDCDCSYCEAGYKLSVEEADRLGYEVDPDWDYIVCGKKPEGKDGQTRSKVGITARSLQLLGGAERAPQGPESFEDDVPF